MNTDRDKVLALGASDASSVDVAMRIALLGLLAYGSLKVIGPFLTVGLWSIILTIAVYPVFAWLARELGNRGLAAALTTSVCLMIVVGPVTWLGFGLIGGVEFVVSDLDHLISSFPRPPESVRDWPVIGERVYRLWTNVATDTKELLLEAAPRLRPLGVKLLEMAGTVVFGLVEFIASIVVAGFLLSPGPHLVDALAVVSRRIFGRHSDGMMLLVGSTIRNVSRGVVGIALAQSFLAGVGLLVAGVPAAGFFSFLALVLSIVQIGPAIVLIPIVVWSWLAMKATSAVIFTAYMVLVSVMDNVLRPFVMGHGLTTPMPVIFVGVMGGILANGISGLFLGPIILSVAWALTVGWAQQGEAPRDADCQ
jgi:predicted PurR-regulated permease PerM